MVVDDSCTCGEHSIVYRDAESVHMKLMQYDKVKKIRKIKRGPLNSVVRAYSTVNVIG